MMHRIVEKIHEFSLRYEGTMHRNFQHVTKFSLRYDGQKTTMFFNLISKIIKINWYRT